MAEKKPIIKVWFSRAREASYALSEDEVKEIFGRVAKKREELGVKQIVTCDCYWANEEWTSFGVEEFPDIEALQEFTKFIKENQWPRGIESKSYLGTPQ